MYDDLPIILEDFLNYMESIRGSSSNTVDEYMLDLRIFLRFLKRRYRLVESDVEFSDIVISDIDEDLLRKVNIRDLHAYISYVDKDRGNGVSGKSRKVASLRSFFHYLSTTIELLDKNPSAALETPKQESRHPVYLTLEESHRLLETILENPDDKYRARDYAIIVLFLNCGMRLSELASINISSIKDNDTLSVIGKGNKERTIFLNNACISAIDDYLKVRPKEVNDPDALFISLQRNRMNKRSIQHMVKKYIKNSGLDPKIYSTHTLRHTAATLMYKYGEVDIRALQEILGHESVATTQIYTHIDSERLKGAVDSNPLNALTK